MSIPKLYKAVFFMAGLCLVGGLFGCQKAVHSAQHQLSEIVSVSISCGHMDRSYGYSFWAHQEENGWFLDAQCFTQNHEVETAYENHLLDGADVEALLEILDRHASIAYVENDRKSNPFSMPVADETAYSFALTFSDGKQSVTSDRQDHLEEFFYRLVEKYGETE